MHTLRLTSSSSARLLEQLLDLRIIYLIYWALGLMFILPCPGAPSPYHIDTWQADAGLPQGTVTSIVQTPDGYLWLGTQNGLARFDGVNFVVFNQDNTPAIKNNRIVQLFVDHTGTLWISAEQGNLVRLQNGKFTAYEMPGKDTPFNYARGFCDDAAGNLWIVSCEWQLLCLGEKGFTVWSTNWNLRGVQAAAIASDQSEHVWVQTELELATFQTGTFRTMWNETNEANFHVDLGKSREGGIWVAANNRLRKIESGRWLTDLGPFAWTNSPIYDLYEDSNKRVWVATMGGGLFRFSPDGTVLHLTTEDGLPSDFVRCIIEDREGNIWVGMESGGLSRMKSAAFQSLGARQGLASDQVTSICESTDDSFWIAMNGAGLDHLLNNGQVEHYGSSQGLMNGHVWSVYRSRRGIVWAGTWDGLFKRDEGGFVNLSDGVKIGRQVFAISEDRQGDILVGQQGFGALTRLHGEEKTPIKIPGASPSLDVRAVVQDAADGLWIGTESDGLFHLQDGICSHFGKTNGLASDAIWSLHSDADGTIWIGTCGGGLSRWRAGKITTWTAKNGLASDVICQILEDDDNNLWLGSYSGVFRINKLAFDALNSANNSIQCISYDKSDGLPSVECVGGFQPSGYRSLDGSLWFPTVKGFAIVNPKDIRSNLLPPPVAIENVTADGSSLLPGSGAIDANNPADLLKVPPGRRRLEFQYTALSLTAPEKIRFRYQLKGLENQWQDAGGKRTADYNRIPPGRYEFNVIACNNDGVWNYTGATLPIYVQPYFWETKWFAAFVVLATLGTVAGSVRYVVRQKLQRRIELVERQHAIEAERGRIANDIHDDLGAGLTEIVILSQLVQNAGLSSDPVQSDVRRITDKAQVLTQTLDEIVWAMNMQNDTLEGFVAYACNYAQEYLELAEIRCRLEMPDELPDIPLTADIRHNLFMALKEALNNIVKHSHASEVWIQTTVEPGTFTLTVRDNGKGLGHDSTTDDPGAGQSSLTENPGKDGLLNMRKRMESIGGRLRLQSSNEHGTQIEFIVPLRNP